jgi:hypothetical protein
MFFWPQLKRDVNGVLQGDPFEMSQKVVYGTFLSVDQRRSDFQGF